MKKHRISDILFVFCILAVLFGVLGLTLTRQREEVSHYENRRLAVFPEFSQEALLSGEFFAGIDEFLGDHSAFRTTLFRAKGWADIYLLRRPVVNDIIILDGLLLHYFPREVAPSPQWLQQEAQARARELADLQAIINEYGGHFLYVAVPDQTAYFMDYFPHFLNNRQGYRPQLEAFRAALYAYEVPFLDMGERFSAQGNPFDFYSGVDHHFSMYGAFYTYLAIIDTLIEQTGLDIPRLDWEDFIFEVLPNPYVGSRGRLLWGMAPFTEHITIARPRVEVPFYHWRNHGARDASVFEFPNYDWQEIFFGVYMGGDHALTNIWTNRPELPSILFFGDSFTNAVETVLYLNFNTMTGIDLRHFDEMSLAEFIKEHQPPIVVCLRDYSVLLYGGGNGRLFS